MSAEGLRGAAAVGSGSAIALPEGELSLAAIPILADHVVAGRPVVPLALMLEWIAGAAESMGFGGGRGPHSGPYEVHDLRVVRPMTVDEPSRRWSVLRGPGDGARVVSVGADGAAVVHATATIASRDPRAAVEFARIPAGGGAQDAGIADIYSDTLFHGPSLRLIDQIDSIDERGARAIVRCDARPRDWITNDERASWQANPPAVDAALQLGIVWTSRVRGLASLPMGIGAWRMIAAEWPTAASIEVVLIVRSVSGPRLRADVTFVHDGRAIAELHAVDWIMDTGLAATFGAQADVNAGARR